MNADPALSAPKPVTPPGGTGPALPADPLLQQVLDAQARHHFFTGPTLVVVAVSGGRDSVCLLHVLHALAPALNLELHVAHVDHGLRPESGADRAWVETLCTAWGLSCHSTVLDPVALRADALGVEGAARRARYAFLAQTAHTLSTTAQPGAPVPPALPVCVATAHHAGDQAETVLLRLVQGSGPRGLGAMRPVTATPATPGAPPVTLVRPLLAIVPAAIATYGARWGLTWREDATNADLHPLRNRLRHTVVPALQAINPALLETLARTAEVMAAEAERAEQADRQALAALAVTPLAGSDGSRHVIDLVRWQALPLAARRGIVHIALGSLGADERETGFAAVERIVASAQPRTSGPHPVAGAGTAALAWSTLGANAHHPALLCLHRSAVLPVAPDHPWLDAAWRAAHDPLVIPLETTVTVGAWQLRATRLSTTDLPAGWETAAQPWRLMLPAELAGQLMLTTPVPGLRIAPFGMGGQHKLVADVLATAKMHPQVRPGWPILVEGDSGRVLWVCGLRRAECTRLASTAQQVVCIAWQPAPAAVASPLATGTHEAAGV